MEYEVRVFMLSCHMHSFPGGALAQAREYAKSIIVKGLWVKEPFDVMYDECDVFYPVHQIDKVMIVPCIE